MTVPRLAALAAALAALGACLDEPHDAPGDEPAGRARLAVPVDPGAAPDELAAARADPPVELAVCGDAAYPTIGAALAAAPPGAVIRICPGVYAEHLDVTAAVSLIGAGAGATILDGGDTGRVVRTRGASVSIDGVTIQHGLARTPPDAAEPDADGGGVECVSGALRIARSVIRENVADGLGGGIRAAGCPVALDDVEISDNKASYGGGLFAAAAAVEVTGSRFLGNRAYSGGGVWATTERIRFTGSLVRGNRGASEGGGLRVDAEDGWFADNVIEGNSGGGLTMWRSGFTALHDNAVVDNVGSGYWLGRGSYTISGGVIRGNTAHSGGGIKLFAGELWLARVVVEENRALVAGGGIYASGAPGVGTAITVDDSVVRANLASSGGGIVSGTGGLRVRRSVIAHNTAERGGGIVTGRTTEPVELTGSTFDGNVAAGDGGAVHTSLADLRVRNSVFTANRAGRGGALWLGGDVATAEPPCASCPGVPHVRVEQSTFRANEAEAGSAIAVAGHLLTATGNVLADTTVRAQLAVLDPSAAVTWRYNDTFPATFTGLPDPTGLDGNLAADPRFVDALRLGAGSACIDRGPPDLLDLDGTRADMGAFGGPEPLPLP